MRHGAKLGVLLLGLLMGGEPLMACMLPSSVLTPAEQACCRRMANQCSHNGMPSSHSCCKTISAPDRSTVAKSSFRLAYQVQLLYLAQPTNQLSVIPQLGSTTSAVLGHSPPQSPPSSSDILRI